MGIIKERKLLQNAIICPDGTILNSKHTHDYQAHEQADGTYYMRDGGLSYIRGAGDKPKEDLTLYTDDPFEVIREKYLIGKRRLKDVDTKELKILPAVLNHEWIFNKEIEYRNDKNK